MKTGPVSIHPGLVAVVLISATSAWLLAQQEIPQPPPIFRSTADVVRVEASVLDKDRRPVRGLQAGDFSVLENGHERPLVAFAPIELPPAAPASIAGAAWLRDAPRDVVSNGGADAGRLVVIAFDWSIRFYDQAAARRIALAAVDGLGPTDDAAVVFTKPNAAAGKPQGFTADRSLLRAAINQPFAVALTQPDWTIIDPDGYDTTAGECLCGICPLEALTGLGHTLRTVSQRPKVLLFIGTYVRTFDAMRATKPVVKPGTITDAYAMTPGWTDCPARLRDARRAFERAMGEANVTVHVLNPVGLDTEGTTPLGPKRIRERLDSLPVIADMTGGRTVLNTNAPEAHVAAILEESAAYYVLGFTPAPPVKGETTRRIEVRVRPRDVTVRARREYTLAEQPTASAPAQGVLTRAMAEVLPARSVPLEVSAVALIAGDRSAAVLIGRLGEGAARPTAVVTAAFTPRAAPVVSRRITIAPTTAGRGTGSRALGLVSALALEAGSYEIRLATELPGGAAGSVHTFVDIPDFRQAPLSMSGVLLHVAPEEPVASRDEIDNALPFVPTARRSFASTDIVSAFVQVSQGTTRKDALQPASLVLRIKDVRDKALRNQTGALSTAEFARHRTANVRLTLPLRELPPGQYLLTLEATSGERRAERSLRFDLR